MIAVPSESPAQWTLIDDFNSYAAGESLDSQTNGNGEWVSPAYSDFFVIEADPTDQTNNVVSVLEVDSGTKNIYLEDDRINISDGETGTLFVRFYRDVFETHVNFGLSDVDSPAAWADFEAQFRDQLAVPFARDGGRFTALDSLDELPEGEWLSYWIVIDNDTDTNEYYLQNGTTIPDQIKLSAGGRDTFDFRNGTSDPLTTFLLRTNNESNGTNIHIGPWYLDDIYFDGSGENLTDPLAGGGLLGDFDGSGVLDGPDIDDLTRRSASLEDPAAYDLNGDTVVDDRDVKVWIKDLLNSWIGDADLDKEFDSGDLVMVLAAGTFGKNVDSVWSTGDFNGDGRSNSSDLVIALADGGFGAGQRPATAAVPEPSALALLSLGILFFGRMFRASVEVK